MTFTIAITTPDFDRAGTEVLNRAGCRTLFTPTPDRVEDLERILRENPVEAIISRTMLLPGPAIRASSALKVISRHGIGVNHIDVGAATELGIPVLTTPGTNGQSVAELTVALMLAVAREVARQDAAIRAGGWDRTAHGLQLSGRTLGIVGLGAIGRRVAQAALGLGMRVVAHRGAAAGLPVEMLPSLEALLAQADVLTLHCPLDERTRGMIGAAELRSLPQGAIVVNTSRGALIDEVALVAALQDGHLFGAGLDAFITEPLPGDHPLKTLPNVVLTPHMGGASDKALELTAIAAAENALRALRGEWIDPAICANPVTLRQPG